MHNRRLFYLAIFWGWLILSAIIILNITTTGDSGFAINLSLTKSNHLELTAIALLEIVLFVGWLGLQMRGNHSLSEVLGKLLKASREIFFLVAELVVGLYTTIVLFTVKTPDLITKIILLSVGIFALIAIEYFNKNRE